MKKFGLVVKQCLADLQRRFIFLMLILYRIGDMKYFFETVYLYVYMGGLFFKKLDTVSIFCELIPCFHL